MSYAVFAANEIGQGIVEGAQTFGLGDLADCKLDAYKAIALIGSGSIENETVLSNAVLDKLWHYVKAGGTLYAEMISAFDFTSSRLFGWKQDFPATRRTFEKLRIGAANGGLPEGALLEWDGAYAAGFPIEVERWLDIGVFHETLVAASKDEEDGRPGLFVKSHGKGTVVYAAFSLFSGRSRWTLRPYGLWAQVVSALSARTGIPFRMWERVIAPSGGTAPELAVAASAEWFEQSGMLGAADGSEGVFENIHSVTAALSRDRRPDCHAHTALFFHLYGRYTGEERWESVSRNLLSYLFESGYQDTDPASPSCGFFKWYDFPDAKPHQLFTDDNAWVCFVLLYLYRKTGLEAYRARGMATAEALLATQNANGLRPNVLTGEQLRERGRKHAQTLEGSMNPHFESIAHAAFIQAYLVTGEKAYVEAALRGSLQLLANPDKLQFMYSKTSGISRLVLPLGFLSKHDRTGAIAKGLEDSIAYLLANQHSSGAVEEADNPDPERFGKEDTGVFLYNGEGIADQLYTNNFLLMNAWEAWKATGNPRYEALYRSLSGYMCRIQIESPDKRFHGGWMRAFDLNRNEYFGNNGDTGWGPYCMESGWTNAITPAGLLLSLLDESVFE
ncbi:hypothetical protein [Paenibacillus sp. MBLB4367]|uniref:hypothetical protein n=1 Tax=Paenibacillus sp. MBLB4367 TaxID=3384767 RepID=UPI003907EC3E